MQHRTCRFQRFLAFVAFTFSFLVLIGATRESVVPSVRADQTGNTTIFYVSPNGNDSWSGSLAEVNASRSDGPFASIQAARDAIRRLRKKGSLSSPVTVYLRGGQYPLSETVIFTDEDSGTPKAPSRRWRPTSWTWSGRFSKSWSARSRSRCSTLRTIASPFRK